MAQVHNRNQSTESTGSIASIQSADSVSSTTSNASESASIYKDIAPTIERRLSAVKDQELDLAKDISRAEYLVDCLKKSNEHEISFSGSTLELDAVMKGMLEHAVGAEGKRYVLAAILECGSKADEEGEGDEEWLKILVTHLRAVAQTWVFYLLFIFKVGPGSHKAQKFFESSGAATPTLEDTATRLDQGAGQSRTMPVEDVKRRDGYRCVITGFLHLKHLYGRTGKAATQFQVAHILRRAAASFPRENTGNAALTFDILRNFTGLPVDVIENLEDHADHVANGLTLLSMAHGEWDDYNFCLKATEVDHVYKIHYFNPLIEDMLEDMRGLAGIPRGELVRFSDHCDDFQPQKRRKPNEEDQAPSTSASSSRSSLRFELPSKTFIAIHAAVGGVLHMSGAGKFFDELLDKYDKDDEKNRPVRSWDDFEDKIRSFHLNEWLRQGLRIGGATPA